MVAHPWKPERKEESAMAKLLSFIIVLSLTFPCYSSAAMSQETSPQPGFKVNATSEQIRKNREQIQNEIKGSGMMPSSEADKPYTILKNIQSSTEPTNNVRLSDLQCYRNGCLAMLRFPTLSAFIDGQHALGDSAKAAWSGPVVVTGPEGQADGTIQSMLVLRNRKPY
jgi:hypothetical protein